MAGPRAAMQPSHRVGPAGTDPAGSVAASTEPREALLLLRASAPPAIFCRRRKTLLPDPGAPSPWESTDGLLVKVWAWKSGALDAFPGYIRNLLCGTTYFLRPRFLLLLLSRSPLFPDLSPRCSNVFFLSQRAFLRLQSLLVCCHQYLDQTPTPAQASSASTPFPSILPSPCAAAV